MIQNAFPVTANRRISGACYKMTLAAPEIAATARPGQFVMIRPGRDMKPFLPRPFSIHRISNQNGELELLYRVVGDGTRQMAGLAAGRSLDMLGPLGKGFQIEQAFKKVSIIAGGIGVAPLVFLAEVLAAGNSGPVRAEVFIGGATAGDVLCRDEFTRLKMQVHISTDDGSAGYHGFVTELFAKTISAETPDMVFACGPPAMLRAVAQITAAKKIPCQVSVETIMACGIGACLGCAIKSSGDSGNYKHACRDGPVFFTTDIDINSLTFLCHRPA